MCDPDAPVAFLQTLRTARQGHLCYECRALISKGEVYEYSSGVWYHRGASFKTCMPCAEVRAEYNASLSRYDYSPAFGALHDECAIEEFY